jgi:hypothetical protein
VSEWTDNRLADLQLAAEQAVVELRQIKWLLAVLAARDSNASLRETLKDAEEETK